MPEDNLTEPDPKDKGHEAYEEYLLLLQQRNRLLKKLKEKDEKQLDLEKKEQGFSLYLNGANVGLHLSGNYRPRKSKTAGEVRNETPRKDAESRLKTAPVSKPARKVWNESPPDKIKIRTKDGDKVSMDLPDLVSGNYEEDFELYQSFLQTKLEAEDDDKHESNDDDFDDEEECEDDDDHQQMEHQLTFTVQDLKTLRASLEKDSTICRSIADATGDLSSEENSDNDDAIVSKNQHSDDAVELEEIEEEVDDDNSDDLDVSMVMTSRDISEEILEVENSEDDDDEELICTERNDDDLSFKSPEKSSSPTDMSFKLPEKSSSPTDMSFKLPEKSSLLTDKPTRSFDSASIKESSSAQFTSHSKSNEFFELHGAAPKNRPVTGTRKRNDNDSNFSMTASVMSDDVASAIEEENRLLAEYKGKRESNTAPEVRTTDEPTKSIVSSNRPQTIANPLSHDDISSITERVRKMTGRQQRRLLRMLAELEDAEQSQQQIADLNVDNNDSRGKKVQRNCSDLPKAFTTTNIPPQQKQKHTESSSHRESSFHRETSSQREVPIEQQISSPQTLKTTRDYQRVSEQQQHSQKESSTSKTRVSFEFSSNWGSEEYIGLTEIQLIKQDNELIHVRSKDINIISDHVTRDDVKVLVNGKMKTTKGRNMWMGDHEKDRPLQIILTLHDVDVTSICKILLWNYNKSLHDLNIGVKDCKISLNDHVVWEGIIDKGCGNQIFDYSKIISLKKDEEISEVIDHSNTQHEEDRLQSPEENMVDLMSSVVIDTQRPGTRTTDASGVNRKDLPVINVPPLDSRSQQKAWSSPRDENIPEMRKQSERCDHGKPSWLTEPTKVKDQSGKDDYIDDSLRPRSRPSSGRRSQLPTTVSRDDDILSFDENIKPRSRPSSGRRSQSSTPDLSENVTTDKNKKELDMLFDLNTKTRRRQQNIMVDDSTDVRQSVSGDVRQQPIMINLPSSKHTNELKSERQLFKGVMDVNLEESLRSIDKFNFHHLGRITASLDDAGLSADETLGSFLQPMKQDDHAMLTDHAMLAEQSQIKESLTMAHSCDDDEESELSDDSPRFEIPLLPKGKELIINIKTTWGDRHYVGFNGIEVFTADGNLAPVTKIEANPKDINVLPEYEGDPRVVDNLVDGCYLTRDDLHLWLTPYTLGNDHLVALHFQEDITISMIRVWNYNKSRIHSSRGARFIEMALDGKLIFIGEIARASGVLSAEDLYGDTILFTMDEEILERVGKHDPTYEVDADDDEENLASSIDLTQRPSTATDDSSTRDDIERPFTAPKPRDNLRADRAIEPMEELTEDVLWSSPDSDGFMECKVVCIFFTGTWGDMHYMGLTGLEVLGETFERIPLNLDMIEASPKDLNDLEDYTDDDRTLDKLINGTNVTVSDENMWMIPFDVEQAHFLKITFDEPTIVTGIRVWNYNKSMEDTFRGAKSIHIYLDENEISPYNGFLLRKGPGHCHFDFAQDILFHPQQTDDEDKKHNSRHAKINLQKVVNEYEAMMMPCGFVFQLRLYSSWGDQYYIGLNGIEVYDEYGELVPLTDNNITAFPFGVNILENAEDDIRTPDKLVDGVYSTYDARHMWLAPVLPGQVNIVYIVFDEPITVSMMKIWNYSKTPSRGVRQFGLFVDDLLVYSGALPQPALFTRGIIPGVEVPVPHHTILFTDAEDIALAEKRFLLSSSISVEEQGVTLTNEKSVLKTHKDKYSKTSANPAMRPKTSVTGKAKY